MGIALVEVCILFVAHSFPSAIGVFGMRSLLRKFQLSSHSLPSLRVVIVSETNISNIVSLEYRYEYPLLPFVCNTSHFQVLAIPSSFSSVIP